MATFKYEFKVKESGEDLLITLLVTGSESFTVSFEDRVPDSSSYADGKAHLLQQLKLYLGSLLKDIEEYSLNQT